MKRKCLKPQPYVFTYKSSFKYSFKPKKFNDEKTNVNSDGSIIYCRSLNGSG